MVEDRRIIWDDKDDEIYKHLKESSGPFKNKDLVLSDLFAIALIYGKKQGFRKDLTSPSKGRIRSSSISSNLRNLMRAIAIDEENANIDVLADQNKYFRISEEYAKTGIQFLEADFVEKGDDILDDMEDELLEFFDEHIAESSD